MQLIVTRPKEDAVATASALQAAGHEAIIAPLISIETIFETPIPDQNWQGILVSSANGVRALVERSQASALSDTPLLAVGEASAGAAKDAGFSTVKSANGGLPELVRLACSTFTAQGGPLLYLSGTVISGDLKAELEGRGFQVHRAQIYSAKPAECLSENALSALRTGSADAVGLFSRRSAKIWIELVNAAGLSGEAAKLKHICLSPAVAETIKGGWSGPRRPTLICSATPDLVGFLKAMEKVL